MKRERVVWKDLSRVSPPGPSKVLLFAKENFSSKDVSDSAISDIGGRNNFSGCSGKQLRLTKIQRFQKFLNLYLSNITQYIYLNVYLNTERDDICKSGGSLGSECSSDIWINHLCQMCSIMKPR